ncbi:MAG: response regulator [Pseudomonadota bacterium]|nr:response regulator [Pseudomonadota bacterium]
MTQRILIVDDEPHVIHVLKTFLERKGFSVFSAHNGQQALDVYKKSQPHVVITDIQMPIMSGQALCEQLLHDYTHDTAKLIVVTSRTDIALRSWAKSYPMIDFIEKPLSMRRLVSKLDEFFVLAV